MINDVHYSTMSLLDELNPPQRQAVTFGNGPLLILAGAGSGKTRALTYRVAYLIREKGVNPEQILVVTFTNKAAGEMKERIYKLVGQIPPLAGTFHSFCAKLLRQEGHLLGIPKNYLIYDIPDQLEAVKEVIGRLDLPADRYRPGSVLAVISQAKNELIGPEEYPAYARGEFQKKVAQVYKLYQNLLRDSKALDFDDLLFFTVKLFRQNGDILEKYQNRFRYILVDEYQDTNRAQYELTRLLAKKRGNLCVVGDASQAIYGFRGADYRNLLRLAQDFSELTTINLEQNYRSSQTILDAAHAVIARNTSHPVLHLWTAKDGGEKVKIYQARSELDEASLIIAKLIEEGVSFSDAAVLYRTNAQSRVLEEAFLHAGIPYILVGGVRFYERREVKDCLAYLRLLANSDDLVSAKRVEKLGKRRLDKFLSYREKIEKEASADKTTLELLDGVLEATDYLSRFDEDNEQDLARLENIKELRSVAAQSPQLSAFLENVALVEQEQLPSHPVHDQGKNAVTLMTAHAAKGLEFPLVFIVGMEEGLFPHSRSMMSKDELEEERRLFYVGMTRAMEKLYLTFARRRLYFGQRAQNQVSRFLADIPEELVENLSGGSLTGATLDDIPF